MFLSTSRYAKVKTVQSTARGGRQVSAVALRRLPPTAGDATQIGGTDRLDTIAFRQYNDATRFWYIADANTELDSRNLVKPAEPEIPNPLVRVIKVPAK